MNQFVDIGVFRCCDQAFPAGFVPGFEPNRMGLSRIFIDLGLDLTHVINIGHNGIRAVADGFITFAFPGYQLKEVWIDIMEKLVGRTTAFDETVFDTSELIIMLEYRTFFSALEKHRKALFIGAGTLIRVTQTVGYG